MRLWGSRLAISAHTPSFRNITNGSEWCMCTPILRSRRRYWHCKVECCNGETSGILLGTSSDLCLLSTSSNTWDTTFVQKYIMTKNVIKTRVYTFWHKWSRDHCCDSRFAYKQPLYQKHRVIGTSWMKSSSSLSAAWQQQLLWTALATANRANGSLKEAAINHYVHPFSRSVIFYLHTLFAQAFSLFDGNIQR